jgi:hypothetical protein
MKDEASNVCKKAEDLIVQVVHAFLLEQSGTHQTLKISSSEQFETHGTLKLSSSSSGECSFKTANGSISISNLSTDNDEVRKDVTEGNLNNFYIITFTFVL